MSTAATGTVCHETARPRPPQLMATALPPRQPGHRPATITTSRHTLTPALATLVTTFWSRVRDQETNNPPNLLLVLCWCCHGLCGGWWCEAGPGQSWDHVTTAASSHQPAAASPMITHKYLHNTRQQPPALHEPSFSASDSISRRHPSFWAFISIGGIS